MVSGFIVTKQYKAAVGIFASLILLWYVFETGRIAYYFPWFHLLVLVSFLLLNKLSLKLIGTKTYVFVSLFYAAIMGVLSDHLVGSIAYTYVYDLSAEAFKSVIFIYPTERIILALSATLISYFFFTVFRDIVLSSDDVEADLARMKNKDLADYLYNDVQSIIGKKGNK
jgi:hypothetical protein